MRFTRAALVAGVLACATAAPASATDNGATYNNPFNTGDLSDCVYPKARAGISAFAFDGAPVPFTLDARAPWPGCEHAPGSIRVLKLQALNVGGQVTYLTRGGTAEGEAFPGEPHVHIPATALRRVPKLLDARSAQHERAQRAELLAPDHGPPDRASGGDEVQAPAGFGQRRLMGQLRRPGRALRHQLHVHALEPAPPG